MSRATIAGRILTNMQVARMAKGLTLEQLGYEHVRIDPEYLGQFECQKLIPVRDQAERIAKFLDIPTDVLLEPVELPARSEEKQVAGER